MSITNGYTTVAEIKSTDRLDIAVTTYDTSFEGVIEAISRAIDSRCARFFWKDTSDVTRYFTADAYGRISIGDYVSITSLATDYGDRTYSTAWTVDTDYDLWPYNASQDNEPYRRIETSPFSSLAFPLGTRKGVKVIGKRGWPAVPKPIKEACLIWSMRTYQRYKTPLGVSATTALGTMDVKVPPPDPDVMMLIAPYMLIL